MSAACPGAAGFPPRPPDRRPPAPRHVRPWQFCGRCRKPPCSRPGAARQPTGVAFYGILSDVESKCTRSGDAVLVALDTVIIGERGPASGAATGVDLQYFIAATGPDDTILSKRTLPVQIAIPAGTRRAGITDHVEEWVSLGGRSPGDVKVVLGFQQSPEVVQFYKNFRGR